MVCICSISLKVIYFVVTNVVENYHLFITLFVIDWGYQSKAYQFGIRQPECCCGRIGDCKEVLVPSRCHPAGRIPRGEDPSSGGGEATVCSDVRRRSSVTPATESLICQRCIWSGGWISQFVIVFYFNGTNNLHPPIKIDRDLISHKHKENQIPMTIHLMFVFFKNKYI